MQENPSPKIQLSEMTLDDRDQLAAILAATSEGGYAARQEQIGEYGLGKQHFPEGTQLEELLGKYDLPAPITRQLRYLHPENYNTEDFVRSINSTAQKAFDLLNTQD